MKSLPRVHRAQLEVGITFVYPHRFSSKIWAADLDHDISDFRKGPQSLLHPLADLNRIGQRNTRQLACLDQNRSLVESRHELCANEEQRAERNSQNDNG